MREYKNVCGKCHCCEKLKTLLKESTLPSDRLLAREYKMLHRQNIMGEKIKYQERRLEALESKKICGVSRVQSLIFDSMTKRSTALPTLSNKAAFKGEQFVNNLMGCISHSDKEKRFYTSYGSVDSGASYMIHCIHSEILRKVDECERKRVPLPDKWYIQIDGASDNTAKAVLASIEHLQIEGLANTIEVWRLPVGHTHEDIDALFGVIFKHIRSDSIPSYQVFVNEVKKAFNYSQSVSIISVPAIFNYKKFYDKFIDPKLKILKEEQTQHGWRVERLSFEENRDFGQILNVGIKTNYRKSAQTVSFDLRKVNPVHDPDAESEAYIFSPVIRVSAWLPQDAIDDRGYKPGLSFLCTRPIGCPTPLSFSKNWYNNHKVFIMCIKEEFSEVTQKDAGIIEDWKIFTETVLPPSQFMIDYVTKMGSNFFPPLCQYLYGLRPRGFSQLRSSVTAGVIENASRFLSTSFAGVNMTRATLVDKALENIVCQNRESVEWRGNTTSLKAWQFDVPEMLAKVIVEVKQRVDLSREDKSYKMENIEHEGTIVAFCKSDINEGDVFQIYVEEVKRTVTLEASEYCVARKKYLTLYEMDETASDAKVFQQRGRNVVRQINNEITAAKRTAAQQQKQQKQQDKQQKALELKSQREIKMAKKEEEKSRKRNKNNRNIDFKDDIKETAEETFDAIEDFPSLNISQEVDETILPMALEEVADSKDPIIPEIERDYNTTVHLTTRSGRRQISGGQNIELRCGCGECDQTKLYPMISLKKCRQCNIHVLITHLSPAWTCQKCYNDDDVDNCSEDDD